MIKLLLLLCVTTSLFALNFTTEEQTYLKNKKSLTVMNVDKFQPFTFLEDNKPSGYTVDIMKLMGKQIGKDVKFITAPWAKQLENLKDGTLDVIPYMVKTKDRQKFISFTSYSHITFSIGFAADKKYNIRSIRDLNGKVLAVVEKSFMYEHIKQKFPNIKLYGTKSVQESLELVTQNRAHATLDNITTLNYLIKEGWLNHLKINTIDDLGLPLSNTLYMGVKKNNLVLKSILEKIHTSLPLDEVEQLKRKWFYNDSNELHLTLKEQEYLNSKSYLSVMSLPNFQPFSFVKDNEHLGYSVEIMKIIGKILNKEIKFINEPWGVQLDMLKDGSLDIIPHIAVNEKRKDFVSYTDFDHLTFLIGFAINKNDDISLMKDFSGKKIAVVNKYYLHDYLKKAFPNIELLVTLSTEDAVNAVAQGKAFAVIDNIPTLNYFIQEKWLTNLKVDTVEDLGLPMETKMPMGVSKGNLLLKSILEKAHDAIAHEKVIKLKRNWMGNEADKLNNNSLSNDEIRYLKKKKKILMCVLPNWLPFEQIDEHNQHKGIGADFMKVISQYINTPIVLLPTKTWSESLSNIRERKCDILPVAMDVPSRRDAMNFTKPYVSEPFVIATKSDELFIKDVSALSNRKIGIVKSYAFIEVLKSQNPSIEIIPVKNTKEGLDKVRSGELFGYVDTMPTIGYGIQKYSFLDLKIAGKLEFDIKLSIASRNDEMILNSIMQKAIDSISKEERRSIIGKWISIKVSQEFDYVILWQLSGLFLLILLAILYKNSAVSRVNKKLMEANNAIAEQQKMVDKYVLILTTDLKGIITEVNDAYCKVIGFNRSELVGKTHTLMKHPEMDKQFFDDMWNDINANKTWNGEIKNLRKDGDTVWFFLNIEPIFKNNIKIGYRSISEDITNKKKIEKLSITDQLTQLYNRHKLESSFIIEIERAKRYQHPLSMILLDIDYFKSVNDDFGHDIGDETLKCVAKILKNSIRLTDIVGRWGGEEFILIVPNTDLQDAQKLAEKIRHAIEGYSFKEIGHKTASFGISTFNKGDTKESLVKRADEALYKAKNNGRNRIEVIN